MTESRHFSLSRLPTKTYAGYYCSIAHISLQCRRLNRLHSSLAVPFREASGLQHKNPRQTVGIAKAVPAIQKAV